MAYKQEGVPTYHYDHSHKDHARVTPFDIRSDLMRNTCKSVLRDYWIEY